MTAAGNAADFAGHPGRALVGVPIRFINADQQGFACRANDELRLTLADIQHMDFKCTGCPGARGQGRGIGAALRGITFNCTPAAAVRFAAPAHIGRGRAVGVGVVNGRPVIVQETHIIAGVIQEGTEGHDIIAVRINRRASGNLLRRAASGIDIVNPHGADIQHLRRGIVQFHPLAGLQCAVRGDELIDQNFTEGRLAWAAAVGDRHIHTGCA